MKPETPEISVVVPVHDEAGAGAALAREIAGAFVGRSYEMIFVDYASRDSPLTELRPLMAGLPALRGARPPTPAGRSTIAFVTARAGSRSISRNEPKRSGRDCAEITADVRHHRHPRQGPGGRRATHQAPASG